MTLTETLDELERDLGRPLTVDEQGLAARMHRANKDVEYIRGVLSTPQEEEPSDDELVTTRYEATIAGPQDITGIWG